MTSDVKYRRWNDNGTKRVIMLHGFTGSERSFEPIIPYLSTEIEVIAPLLPGHGKEPSSLEDLSMESQIQWLREFIVSNELEDAALLGYSMGGRLAIGYAMTYPVKQLILVSSSPGIQSVEERKSRAEADKKLAQSIRQNGIEEFISYWEQIPLFASQQSLPVDVKRRVRAERLQHQPLQLSMSLEQFSTGKMPSYWQQLGTYAGHVTLIVGEQDSKFVAIAEAMEKLLKHSERIVVPRAGHAIQVENPKIFATIIEDVLLRRN
ncbi:2-succinyl-6-hydroxy-2,4-cyclohexadiene-1-carboxylate synthase [Chryseomicrobium excrementi]|uniref:Putative 2-succinyl-6-hydroxy-2,4-cyclohexadiene-1-carboxylate synthase n=1 Tax=Chryseomicrobium excrementi TaxID=2041346 RepID=A0A2M9F1H6_9BACL|nr:2-succinyl-6-hydroxy-2,4-cyclohexadiene-1-carboxylate synthase [Chryseomicrobium excrementi]PJK17317.1 2-succinyl-6-hydroxy-2,4-cyclohexadiene-1-carboxylate synthase [Chryseomicrobium excrementi]